jgi:hypothetical protein
MNKLFPLVFGVATLGLTACPDGGISETDPSDTDDTDVVADCNADEDGDGLPDIYPDNGPLSGGDYTGCETYEGPTVISYRPAPICASSEWSYDIETRGWSAGLQLYIFDRGGPDASDDWGELHNMTEGESQPEQWYDAFSLDLPVVPFNQFNASTNSILVCDKNDDQTLLWGVTAFDVNNPDQVVDCLIISPSTTTDAWISDMTSFQSNDLDFGTLAGCDEVRWQD